MTFADFTFLLNGLKWTVLLTAIGFIGGIPFGLAVALARHSSNRVICSIARAWIGLFQGTPLLMQLFVVYFGLPILGLEVAPWLAVGMAFTAHASAFLGDIWRGAIEAVPRGQTEACHALGLNYRTTMKEIILPQAFRLSLPATIGFLVQLVKGTSLSAIVGFVELSRSGQMLSNLIYKPLLVFGVVGILYFIICWPVSLIGRHLEKQLPASSR
ncbi:amino acid ABC transporter permease (plasmid) [Agrobacterium sp. rho-13.3]|uniref:amino acid ABC transporter permease n=1 Tax=Agrobacterium sp. rho-13.3 TaxID=3072980 RepID=UPI002A0F241D|nr:amino acid ABC transporter permease [Agrobacterium sp. rho-13.3]MDX8312041.1 amino acid ABC transporter permease [Agrobacterium sp. rho-13.3]